VSADGRLTLVIDPAAQPVPTRFASSPRTAISEAVEDLRVREGTDRKNIGFLIASTGRSSREEFAGQAAVVEAVQAWCVSEHIDACVWTALPPNFEQELDLAFSVDAALAYLKRLGKSNRDNALRYIRNAPPEVDRAIRRRVSQEWPNPAS
jgi:hypothetical protein